MTSTAIGVVIVVALILLATLASLDAALPRRRVKNAPTVGPISASTGERGLAARVRDRTLVAGLALGLAMTTGRTLDDQVLDAAHGRTSWAATLVLPDSTAVTRALRVHQRALPS